MMNDANGKKEALIGLVLDATISFSNVYPQIYYILERLLINLQKGAEENNIEIKYGLTILHDHAENVALDAYELYSSDCNNLLRELSRIDFYGGGSEGTENLSSAIDCQLHAMSEYEMKSALSSQNVLLLFTDAMPMDGNMFPDFTDAVQRHENSVVHLGIRAAYFFSYNDDYMPQMRLVDENGMLSENEECLCVYESIGQLLYWSEKETIQNMEKMADDIIDRLKQNGE